jgi:hypothetical protein
VVVPLDSIQHHEAEFIPRVTLHSDALANGYGRNRPAISVKTSANQAEEKQVQFSGYRFERPDLQKAEKPRERNKFSDVNEKSVGVSVARPVDYFRDREKERKGSQDTDELRHSRDSNARRGL